MSLRRQVKALSGQDVQICQACLDCDVETSKDMDIPLSSLTQLVLEGDEEVLYCRTLWSDAALRASVRACQRGLDLHAVMLALRQIAERRAGKEAPSAEA